MCEEYKTQRDMKVAITSIDWPESEDLNPNLDQELECHRQIDRKVEISVPDWPKSGDLTQSQIGLKVWISVPNWPKSGDRSPKLA